MPVAGCHSEREARRISSAGLRFFAPSGLRMTKLGDGRVYEKAVPSNMGKVAVENLLRLIQGGTIPGNIDTGTELVTKDNAAKYK